MPDFRRSSSQEISQEISQKISQSINSLIDPANEIYRLNLEIAELDRDVARLQHQVAATGDPFSRVALVATYAARRAMAGAVDCWTDILILGSPAVRA